MTLEAHLRVRRSARFTLDIELAIEPGTTAALIGPNGAGKSTTVEAIAGIVPIDAGHISLNGRVLDDATAGVFVPPDRRRLGIVFQSYLLFDHLDVLDNIAFGPVSRGVAKRDARAVAHRWVDEFELNGLERRRPPELSGGQAQRVALARALAAEPDLLLLDEPLAALDVSTHAQLRRFLTSHLADYSGPRLLITHDPTDAFLLADQIFVLEDGRISQHGTANDIRRHPATPYVAALTGTNLLTGTNEAGMLTLDGLPVALQTSDTATGGRVIVTVHPRAIALHNEQPHGSPRNAWLTVVAGLEPLGETTRVQLGDPLPLAADITPKAAVGLGLRVGEPVWASVKATEVTVSSE